VNLVGYFLIFLYKDRRAEFLITKCANGDEKIEYYIEMACNGMFGAGKNGMINEPDKDKTFTLLKAEISVFDSKAYEIFMDFKIISEMAKHLPEESSRGREALYIANEIINRFDIDDRETWSEASKLAKKFLQLKNGESQHTITAIGYL
jgi:alpha-mannosidase